MGSEIIGAMDRHGGAESSGASEIPESYLSGIHPFSSAVTGMLESKRGRGLPRGSTWVTVGASVNR